MEKTKLILLLVLIIFGVSACSVQQTQNAPTVIVESRSTQPPGDLPRTESEVPRVTIEDARVALESGTAIIVDVRSSSAYEQSHIAGAISIPLGEIEDNPAGVRLDKEEWIITYCA